MLFKLERICNSTQPNLRALTHKNMYYIKRKTLIVDRPVVVVLHFLADEHVINKEKLDVFLCREQRRDERGRFFNLNLWENMEMKYLLRLVK